MELRPAGRGRKGGERTGQTHTEVCVLSPERRGPGAFRIQVVPTKAWNKPVVRRNKELHLSNWGSPAKSGHGSQPEGRVQSYLIVLTEAV